MSYLKYKIGTGLALFATASFLGGCLNQGQSGSLSSCSSVGACTAGIDPTNPAGFLNPTVKQSPFKLTLKSYWQGDTGKTNPTSWDLKLVKAGEEFDQTTEDCLIPEDAKPAPGSPTGNPGSEANDESVARNDLAGIRMCSVKIPQTQLFYSSLEFAVETPANHECDVVYFDPYYYLFSRSAKATPPWLNSPVDCATLTGGLPAKNCYSGPATDFFNNFPFIITESNPIQNKAVPFKKSWTIRPAQEALNGAFTYGNRWTAFQPGRFGIEAGQPEIVNDHRYDTTIVGSPHDWRFMCVKKGSNLQYRYIVRIIPTLDDPYYAFKYRKNGWKDEYGKDKTEGIDEGQQIPFSISPTQGPIDGGTVLSFSFDDGVHPPIPLQIDPSSAVIIGEPYSGSGFYLNATNSICNPTCTDPKLSCNTCAAPAIASQEAGTPRNVYFSNVASKLRLGSNQFEYKLLKLTSVELVEGVVKVPAEGPAAGGTKIIIKGEGIAKDAKITIDNVACTVDDPNKDWANNGTSIICKTGAHLAGGPFDVIVTNPTSKQDNTNPALIKPQFTYK